MNKTKIETSLLSWYDQNQRDLPWRMTKDPYLIWISEIMAQQTRITALLPYYHRFTQQFPTIYDLAAAEEELVLKMWEGLGYYSRARNIKKAAQIVVDQYQGILPNHKEELLSLPGIGDYTSGAILSIAYHQKEPAIDGNVLRVFSRVENSHLDITMSKAKEKAKEFVSVLMNDRPGCISQSLMELGALVCIPKNPKCEECPISSNCKAYQLGNQRTLPIKKSKKEPIQLDKTVIVVINEKKQVLIRKRTENLLHNLWQYYMIEKNVSEEEVMSLLLVKGYYISKLEKMGDAKHIFTHQIWNMTGYLCLVENDITFDDYIFVDIKDLSKHALPTAFAYFTNSLQ